MAARESLVAGTRGSRLALAQTELALQALRDLHPGLQFQVREIRTEGDRRPDASLATIGGQGVFVKELESALLRREIDIAIHSLKDVPAQPTSGRAQLAGGLTLASFPQRGDPRDALVTRDGRTLAELPSGARIGTGSSRRAVQLRQLRPDVETADIRGNVDTRIRKVDEGQYDATVLAVAGLERLGLRERAAEVFSVDAMIPAAGQGALVLQVRADDKEAAALLLPIDDADTRHSCQAERAFLARLGGGCRLPFGVLAEVDGEELRIRGFISDAPGDRTFRADASGSVAEAAAIGTRLAEQLLDQGAAEFVEAVEAR
ncbi:MAG: hydroxymethylbilane synthase [Chloroflexi bacterium]|nr:hydroxymethylbilane synthase [Chloroflexota bacterium]